MKPVLIFRFISYEGSGYLSTFLNEQGVPWELVAIDDDAPLPASISDYSGIVLMGGPMSANEDLPWIPPLLDLIREAHAMQIPSLGHCLGGQLISKAFGAKISQNPVKEIGWGEVNVCANMIAKEWFGSIETFNAFHWHGEKFALPHGATRLLASDYCENQAYALGHHLVMQTHVEVLPEMVKRWCEEGAEELGLSVQSPAVQEAGEMQQDATLHCSSLNKVASQLYGCWVQNLAS